MNYLTTSYHNYVNESKRLLAPNGKESNLTQELYYYVRTDEFKKWFGDWENDIDSSQMLDENKEPKLFYHGTNKKFKEFDISKATIGWMGRGIYFTDDIQLTKEFGKYLIKVFLNIKKPFIVKGESPNDILTEINKKYNDVDWLEEDVTKLLIGNNDGIIFNHWDKGLMVSCFDPNQIKIIS